MLLYTAEEDSHIWFEGVKGVPFPLHLAESSRHRAFRGCCAVMATKLNSLFQAFPKDQDLRYKWFKDDGVHFHIFIMKCVKSH